jgi:hypothetical protein
MPRPSFSMLAIVCFMNLAASLAQAAPAKDEPALSAVLEIPRGKIYVGQAVEGRIVVAAGTVRPKFSFPTAGAVEVVPLGGFEVQTHASDEIGTVRNVANTYRFPVRIVARKAGTFAIPPIRVEIEGRKGIVAARTIAVVAPPALGRTAAFLGGIGPIKATAEAMPDALRLGETFDYRITLTGPGAVGSADAASIPALKKVGPDWRVDPLPPEGTVVPPSKTLRVRVRPDRPGKFPIGRFLVSYLDPTSGLYRTTATEPVSIQVVDVPVFDAASVSSPAARTPSPLGAAVASLVGLALAGSLMLAARWRVARARGIDPKRVAGELMDRLRRSADGDVSKVAEAAIAEFFTRVGGRPSGAVTPEEARRWTARLSGSTELADAAGRLVQSCDRTLYAGTTSSSLPASTRELAMFFLEELGGSSRAEKPREAPGTA